MSTATASVVASDHAFIAEFVVQRSAIVLEPSKAYLIESRLNPVAREHGLSGIGELVEKIRVAPTGNLASDVIEAMTTNETSFFRDLHPFNLLKTTIIPEMMEKRKKECKLTIWSNACSSGQEPYTIAMLLLDSFPELRNWKVTIHATDLSNQILTKARSGIYNQTEVNRGLPMQLLMKYFVRDGMQWKIKDDIRDMIQFSELNLIERFPHQFQGLDIVFLRNVLIYFCPETKTDILNRVDSSLAADGCLFLGGSESMMNICDRFDRELINNAVFYRPKSS